MTVRTDVPVVLSPEANVRVADLGLRAELEQMLEHTLQTIPNLERVNVILEPAYDTGDDPRLVIEPVRRTICAIAVDALFDSHRSGAGH